MLKQGYWLVEFISIFSVINQARARYERSFLLAQVACVPCIGVIPPALPPRLRRGGPRTSGDRLHG